jgi:hypothetical protein
LIRIYLLKSVYHNCCDGRICLFTKKNGNDVSKSAWYTSSYKELAGNGICQGTKMFYYQMILSRNQLSVGVCCQGTRELWCHYKSVKVRCEANSNRNSIFTNLFVEVVKLLEVYRFGWVVLCFVVFEVIDLFIPCFMSWQNQSMPCSLLHQHDEWLLNICFLPIPISINPCFPMKKQIRLTCLK